ncbi:MAG: acyl-CoA thioesterase [bacterium]|nr:acyl-CoA thioesterase [bacterium]
MKQSHTHRLRVRYDECDPMGFVHHSQYLCYMEIARTELYRESGGSYAAVEAAGLFVVVLRVDCRYRLPARYDDELDISVQIDRMTAARIEQAYQILRGETLIAEANVTLAVVDSSGRPQRIPDILRDPAGVSKT